MDKLFALRYCCHAQTDKKIDGQTDKQMQRRANIHLLMWANIQV